MTFIEKLKERWREANTMVCLGLDTDEALIPINSVLEFNRAIIDKTHPFVCAYKLNIAFYSSDFSAPIWPQGEDNLIETIDYIHEKYSEIPVILDAKIGDVAHAFEKYARMVFERFKADAVTVNPYLGKDALQPFLDYKDKGIIILCRTSNTDAEEFQGTLVYSEKFNQKLGVWIRETPFPLYCKVAERVAKHWNENGNCLLVVGATYPRELKEVRRIVGDMPILVPGIGAQGGDSEGVIKNGLDSTGFGLIINSSRGIIYASRGEDFAEAAAREAKKLQDQINKIKASIN